MCHLPGRRGKKKNKPEKEVRGMMGEWLFGLQLSICLAVSVCVCVVCLIAKELIIQLFFSER